MGVMTSSPSGEAPRQLTVPWYRGYQFRTLLFLVLILGPAIIALHVFLYFSSYTGIVQSLIRRTELLTETLFYSFDNLVSIQADLLQQVTQNPVFLRDLSRLRQVREDPLRFEPVRALLLDRLMDELGVQQDVPLWVQDVVIIDTTGRIWISSQSRLEQRVLTPQLMEALNAYQDAERPGILIWGSEPAFGYYWAWMGIIQPVVDNHGDAWWVIGLVSPDSLVAWMQSFFSLQGMPFLITANGQAFGVPAEEQKGYLSPDEVYEAVIQTPPKINSWSALTWFIWRQIPVHMEIERPANIPKTLYVRDFQRHQVVYQPKDGGRIWVTFPAPFVGENAKMGVVFSLPEVLGPLTKPIARYVQLQALAFLGIMLLAGWWFSRRVARPVREVTESVQAFAEGLWDVRVPVKGQDEFALLAQVFNHMAASLERLYRSLEDEVRRRTYQVRLFLDWLAEAPPEDATSFRSFLQRMLEGLRPFLSQAVHPVLVLWNDDRHTVDWRVVAASDDDEEETTPPLRTPAERNWVQEVLRQRRPALYTQETHRGQIPEPYKAVWIQPLFQQNRPIGALLFYSTQDQTFDELFQNQVQDLAPTVSSAVAFAHLAWVRMYLHQLMEVTTRLMQSVAASADLMGIFFAVARLLERYFPQSILLVRVPETENQWQPLYPATLAGRTLRTLFPISREQRWLLEPDLEALRAVQRLPREVRELAQERNWKGVVTLPVWTQQRLEAVLLLGLEEPGEYPQEILSALSLVMHILAQMLERTDVQEHVRLWQTVMEFFVVSTEAPTLGQALTALVRSLRQLFTEEGDYFFAFVDEEGRIGQSFVFLEGQEQYHFVLSPAEQALVQKVVEEQHPLLFSEPREMFTRLGEPSHLAQSSFPQSWVGLPFVVGGRVLGVWGLRDMHQVHRFDRALVYRLSVLTERLAPAMHYLMRIQHYEHRLQREEWIHALGTHLVSLWDPSVLTQEIAGELLRIFQARQVVFRLHMPTVGETTTMRIREALRDEFPGEGL